MTGRFYSRKEIRLPETGVDPELLAEIPPDCPGLVLYEKKGKRRWLLPVDAKAFLTQAPLLKNARALESDLKKAQTLIAKQAATIERLKGLEANQDAHVAVKRIRKLQAAIATTQQGAKNRAKSWEIAQQNQGAEIMKLRQEATTSKQSISNLQKVNAQLLKNIEDPTLDRRPPRSPKNYVAVAKERGTNFGSPQLQGGLAGLNKK